MTSFAALTAIATPGFGPVASDLPSAGPQDAGQDFSALLALAQDEEETLSAPSLETAAPPPPAPLLVAPQPLPQPITASSHLDAEPLTLAAATAAAYAEQPVVDAQLDAPVGLAEAAQIPLAALPTSAFADETQGDIASLDPQQVSPLSPSAEGQTVATDAKATETTAKAPLTASAQEAQTRAPTQLSQTSVAEGLSAPDQPQDQAGLEQALAALDIEAQDQAVPTAPRAPDTSPPRPEVQPHQQAQASANTPIKAGTIKAEGTKVQDLIDQLGEDALLNLDVTTKTEANSTPAPSVTAYQARLNNPAAGALQNLPTQPVETPRRLRTEAVGRFASAEDQATSSAMAMDEAAAPASSASSNNTAPSSLATALQAQIQGQATPTGQDKLAAPLDPSVTTVDLASLDGSEAGQAMSSQPEAISSAPQALNSTPMSGLAKATIETTAQISAQILRKLEGRSTRFDMTLTPESLGRVDVSLTIEADGQVAARLAFDNPAAASEMRGRVDELRRQLADAGLTLSRDNLEFTERNPQSGSGNGGFDHHQDRRAFAGAARLNQEADLAALPVPAPWAISSQTPDRVDVKV